MDLEKIVQRVSALQRPDGRDEIEVEEINAVTVSVSGFGAVSASQMIKAANDLGMTIVAEPVGLGSSTPTVRLLVCPASSDASGLKVTNFAAEDAGQTYGRWGLWEGGAMPRLRHRWEMRGGGC